jgi:hypothetical protein
MATQEEIRQEEIMKQMIHLVAEGAGQPLPQEAEDELRVRYFEWIVTLQQGNETRPIDIWEEKAGEDIRNQVRKIGETLKDKDTLDAAQTREAAFAVETASTCPHCPPPPDTGG